MQEDIEIASGAISGSLKYISSGSLADVWGAGYFMALKFSGIAYRITSVKVGLTPSEGSGLVELDEDLNGVFKVTNKTVQRFTVQSTDGTSTKTDYYDLSELVMIAPAQYSSMTKEHLIIYATAQGYEVDSSMTKAEIIAVIEAAEA